MAKAVWPRQPAWGRVELIGELEIGRRIGGDIAVWLAVGVPVAVGEVHATRYFELASLPRHSCSQPGVHRIANRVERAEQGELLVCASA